MWQVHIANGPAPPVRDEPPFSRHASRDRSLLKYQIPGIIGGYIGFVLIIGFALLTFGRRLRRAAHGSDGARPLEIVKQARRNFDPSPVSPSQSFRSWRKWGQNKAGAAGSAKSAHVQSTPTFDTGVIEADRTRREQEMEKLYAAVMAQNTRAPKSLGSQEKDFGIGSVEYGELQPARFVPPELAHLNGAVEALYPPYAPMPNDPKAPSPSIMSAGTLTSSPYTATPATTMASHAATPSREDSSRNYYNTSPLGRVSRKRSSLRIATTGRQASRPTSTDNELEVSSPLTATPGESRGAQLHSATSSVNSRRPLTPFPRVASSRMYTAHGITSSPATDNIQSCGHNPNHDYARGEQEALDEARPLPSEAPQRPLSSSSIVPSAIRGTIYPNTTPSTRFHTPSTVNSSTRTLPLRMPSPHANTNTIAITSTIPTPTRTTFLTPRQDHFSSHTNQYFHSHLSPGRNGNGNGDSLVPSPPTAMHTNNTNISSAQLIAAGLATPYSPYMPFSPVTPVTPGLRTREMRVREDGDGRSNRRGGVWREEEGVVPEGEMWGDAWEDD